MRPNANTLSLLLCLCTPAMVHAVEPGAVAASAASAAPAPAAAAIEAGVEALPPAAVPEPRPVRSAAAQERLGADRPDQAAADADAPEIAVEVDEQSAEMEDLRRAEEDAHVGDTAPTPTGVTGRIALLPELDVDLATLQSRYDIPIDVNPAVVAYVRFLQAPAARKHFVKWIGRSYKYMEKYRQILRDEGIPEDTVFLAMIESGFANFAYSRARASGPWQFIASTGKHFGLQQDFWVDQRRDPERAARAAARYLKQLHGQTGDWRLAWASYNAGVGRIYKARARGFQDFWTMAAQPGRKVLRAETKGYVPKLMAAAIIYKHQEAFGFRAQELEKDAWTDYAEVEIPSATLLSVVAQAAGVNERTLIDLNPELRRACTPPRRYLLKIPAAVAPTFAENWPAVQARVRTTFAGHVVRRGDSLSKIAAQYGVPVQGILELNGIKNTRKLKPGTELLIPRTLRGGAAVTKSVSAAPPAPAAAAEAPQRAEAAPRVRPVREAPARHARTADRTVLRVRRGDTLWSISQRYGVEVEDLCRWNRIKSPARYKLVAGKRLVVYPERG